MRSSKFTSGTSVEIIGTCAIVFLNCESTISIVSIVPARYSLIKNSPIGRTSEKFTWSLTEKSATRLRLVRARNCAAFLPTAKYRAGVPAGTFLLRKRNRLELSPPQSPLSVAMTTIPRVFTGRSWMSGWEKSPVASSPRNAVPRMRESSSA